MANPTRNVATGQGVVAAVTAPNARQTFVPLPVAGKGQTNTYGAKVSAVLAPNARQTIIR